MSDIYRPIVAHLKKYQGTQTAYTLLGGRIYADRAPDSAAMPYVVIGASGGSIDRMFGKDNCEQARVTIEVWDLYHGGNTTAPQIWDSLVVLLEYATLPIMENAIFIVMKREGLPRRVVEDTLIQISGDWILAIQKRTGA